MTIFHGIWDDGMGAAVDLMRLIWDVPNPRSDRRTYIFPEPIKTSRILVIGAQNFIESGGEQESDAQNSK